MFPYLNKKLGEVSLGDYSIKPFWLTIYSRDDDIMYRLQFNISSNEDDLYRVPIDNFKLVNGTISFRHCRMGGGSIGGRQFQEYHKYEIDIRSDEGDGVQRLKDVVASINRKSKKGTFSIKITKDLETILNEYRVLSL